ncbi:hypothetical protein BS78_05G271800 [Paspalum vaginatum]|nr:hypothetical protein BS78_05G271800 [Paspalum vaginatum]
MDAADMGLAPSPSPSPSPPSSPRPPTDGSCSPTKVETFVIVAVVGIMFLLHVLGSLRRQTSHSLLHAIVSGVYTLSYPLVSYTIGWMTSSDCLSNDFAVWAVCLLLLLGTTDSLTVCRLNDIDNWKAIYIKHLFKGFMVVLIVLVILLQGNYDDDHGNLWWCPVLGILFVGVLKSYVRIASMRMVSKSYLFKNVKVILEYMKHSSKQQPEVPLDPVTMGGCRFMVTGEKHCVKRAWDKVTTVEQIWRYKGNLLLHGKLASSIKDVCLSMALSKMLNPRFAGFKLCDVEIHHDLVFKGLLAAGGGDHDKLPPTYERAFRVVEQELVFIHDLYYTRYSYLQQKGRYLALCLPAIMVALFSWLTCLLVKNRQGPDQSNILGVTIFITVTLAFLEAYQLYLYLASGWFKVALIQSYVSTPCFQQRRGWCCHLIETIIGLLLRLKGFRPWKGRLGQYSVLNDLSHRCQFWNCLHYATLRLVDKVSKKRRQSSVKLSDDVKKAIVDSLRESNGHLTNGVTSLQNNGIHDRLSWACSDASATATDRGAVARTILIWHIATTLCQQQQDAQSKMEGAVRTASTLSNYCLYLLAFAPQLLSDNCSITSEYILDQSIDEARKRLKGAKTLQERALGLQGG